MCSDFNLQWYQSEHNIVLDIFVKNIKDLDVKYEDDILILSFCTKDGVQYARSLALSHAIKDNDIKIDIGSVKAEIKITKASPQQWKQLVKTEDQDNIVENSLAPSYPTSAKKKDQLGLDRRR